MQQPGGHETGGSTRFGRGLLAFESIMRTPSLFLMLSASVCAAAASSSAAGATGSAEAGRSHATVTFSGNSDAELYTREVAESLQGVLQYNYVSEGSTYPVGFVRASPDPQPWHKTFWTRDGGTFLRELVRWGYLDEAAAEAECLMRLVGRNDAGFYAFPRYFESTVPRSGKELDGTSAIVIGMTMLYKDLPAGHPAKDHLYQFLHGDASPVNYLQHELAQRPLLEGEGEFGGGMGVKGSYCNVVQNQLAALALRSYARLADDAGDQAAGRSARAAAEKLDAGILEHFVGSDGAWIWCIEPKTLQPVPAVLNTATNRGFGGINGVLSMYADVAGLEPAVTAEKLYAVSRRTFEKLYNTPARKRQFDRWGIWTQFDALGGGALTSPSYGMGYSIQDMLLFDDPAMAAKALGFVAENTYRPIPEYVLHRSSPYYFYERMYSPEAVGKVKLEEGCGALNLVNVCEQLKVARMIVGIDDSDPSALALVPRLPRDWTGFEARDWPVHRGGGTTRVSIRVSQSAGATVLHFKSDARIPAINLRLPKGDGWERYRKLDSSEFEVTQLK